MPSVDRSRYCASAGSTNAANVVGDENLLDETDDEEGHAALQPAMAIVRSDCLEVLLDLSKPNDRSGDELREQRHVRRELEEIPRRTNHAPVAVHDVRDRVERVERNADRQNDVEVRDGDVHTSDVEQSCASSAVRNSRT